MNIQITYQVLLTSIVTIILSHYSFYLASPFISFNKVYLQRLNLVRIFFEDVCLALAINIHTVLGFNFCFQHVYNNCLLE